MSFKLLSSHLEDNLYMIYFIALTFILVNFVNY